MQFDYDRWGNRYRKVASNSQSLPFTPIEDADINKATNRFTSTTNIVYDEAGNITTDSKFRSLQLKYDANGRAVSSQPTGGGSEAKAVYDGSGNRVATQANGGWRYMVYDVNGSLVAEYGQATITTEKIRYMMQDRQGSTRVVINQSGSVISRTDYQAFGEEISAGVGRRTTSQGYGQTDSNRQRYAMTERDEATALDHTWFRKYDNKAGRWTSPDPYKGSMNTGSPQSFNRYSYVKNDPMNLIDPTGLFYCTVLTYYVSVCIDGECEQHLDSVRFYCYDYSGRVAPEQSVGNEGGGGDGTFRMGFTNKDDKIPLDLTPDCDNPFLSCEEMEEFIQELLKSVRRRRVELDPDSESYLDHIGPWAKQKNALSKCLQKYKDRCGGNAKKFNQQEAEQEAKAKAPKVRSVDDFLRRGGAILPVLILVSACLICPLCCAVLIPKSGPVRQPILAR
jgi:RHS repeat-associated protein